MSWRRGPKVNRRQWRNVRLLVLDRDGWKCTKCGKAGRMEVDHRIPLEDGGELYGMGNLDVWSAPVSATRNPTNGRSVAMMRPTSLSYLR